jgi:hypothetical protein
MQKIVVSLVGLGVFGVTLAGLLLFGPGGLSGAADPFLQALERRDFVAAAALRTQRFQEAVPQPDFERFLKESRVGQFASGKWSGWKIENGVGSVDGEITTLTGETLPLRVSMRKEDGQWRIDAIQPLRDGVGLDEAARVLPTPVQSVALVRDATMLFAHGVVDRDFSALREAAAPEFKAQFTVADLDAQFKPFVDAGIDLRPLENVPPNFSAEPSVDASGVLRLVGYYPADGGKVDFDYQFVYRYTGWRLISLRVNVVPDA